MNTAFVILDIALLINPLPNEIDDRALPCPYSCRHNNREPLTVNPCQFNVLERCYSF